MHCVSSDVVACVEFVEDVEAVPRIKGLPVSFDVRTKDNLSLPTVNARTAPPGLVVARGWLVNAVCCGDELPVFSFFSYADACVAHALGAVMRMQCPIRRPLSLQYHGHQQFSDTNTRYRIFEALCPNAHVHHHGRTQACAQTSSHTDS
jgi:hypothetical protein